MAATGVRRATRAPVPRPVPVVRATRPEQVVCWDISFLPGTFRGQHYALYLIIDLFSRKILGWTIQHTEDAKIAADLMDDVLSKTTGRVLTVHSDNGSAMTSKAMAAVLGKHTVDQSLIRPSVSNDNAQMESLFRTVKYGPAYPGVFATIDEAEQWFGGFAEAYNHAHHHTKLAGFTPGQVHDGSWIQAARARQEVLDAHWRAHPHRYRQRPQVRVPASVVGLNLGHDDHKTHSPSTLLELLAG